MDYFTFISPSKVIKRVLAPKFPLKQTADAFSLPCSSTVQLQHGLLLFVFFFFCQVLVATLEIFHLHVGSLVEACKLLVTAHGIQFSDQELNPAPCIGSTECQPLDHQGSPYSMFFRVRQIQDPTLALQPTNQRL